MIYEIKKVDFKYPGGERSILNNVSLTLEKGQIFEILGPNGAGKSTLLNCMAGLLKPDSGDIILDGNDIRTMMPKEIARIVGYVPQNHTPSFDYTVLDFVLMGRAPKVGVFGRPAKEDEELCMEILDEMGISHLANRSYMEISGGERQQAMIARATAQEPEVILFDEPTAHLDYGNQHRTLKMIRKMAHKGYAVVITTHNPDHALLLGDKAGIIDKDGHMVSGPCREIITEESLSRVYNCQLRLVYIDEMDRIACVAPKL
ncbi:MAG: ABC transporter ATP-binding protein [Eubacteriaceae bacterium]|nr:ABC transporter ATP-binding protein [Eubacteriaceae bacterium]